MGDITIHDLPAGAEQRLRLRAAAHSRLVEAEARAILLDALDATERGERTWIWALKAAGDEFGGVELPVPEV